MPQTNPFHSLVPRKMTDAELVRAIQLDLEAELDAVNLYAAHIEATDNAQAKAILAHIMDEEKEHASLFLELVRRLDPAYAKLEPEVAAKYELIVSGAPKEVVEAAGEAGAGPAARAAPRPTVGSLRKR